MKKVVCLPVSLWFLCPCAFAAEMEYGSLSSTFATIRKYGPYTVYYDGQNWSG